jgi:hypothetical protein
LVDHVLHLLGNLLIGQRWQVRKSLKATLFWQSSHSFFLLSQKCSICGVVNI